MRADLTEEQRAAIDYPAPQLADSPRWVLVTSRSNFARPGLPRFADSPNHRLRYAAMRDPRADPDSSNASHTTRTTRSDITQRPTHFCHFHASSNSSA